MDCFLKKILLGLGLFCLITSFSWGQVKKVEKNLSLKKKFSISFGETKASFLNNLPAVTIEIQRKGSSLLSKSSGFLKVDAAKKMWIFSLSKGRITPNEWNDLPKGYSIRINTSVGSFTFQKTFMNREILLVVRTKTATSISLFLGRGKFQFTGPKGDFQLEKTGKKASLIGHFQEGGNSAKGGKKTAPKAAPKGGKKTAPKGGKKTASKPAPRGGKKTENPSAKKGEKITKTLSAKEKLNLSFGEFQAHFTHAGNIVVVQVTKTNEPALLKGNPISLTVNKKAKLWTFHLIKGRMSAKFWEKIPPSYGLQIDTAVGTLKTSKTYNGDVTQLEVKAEKTLEITFFLGAGQVAFSHPEGNFKLVNAGGQVHLVAYAKKGFSPKKLAKTPAKTPGKVVKTPAKTPVKVVKTPIKTPVKVVKTPTKVAKKSPTKTETAEEDEEEFLDFLLDNATPSNNNGASGRNKFAGQK